jgi:hypothetical protein
LRNKFQRAIQFYQKLLFEIGLKIEPEAGSQSFRLDKSFLPDAMTKHNFRILRGEEKKRAEALSSTGVKIDETESRITVSNDRYPHMLTALSALCKTKNKFALTNFLRCDFRGLMKTHKPGYDDAVSILPEHFRKMTDEMDAFIQRMNCRISVQPLKNTTLFSQWKLHYCRHGKSVYSFRSDTDRLEAYAHFNHYQNVSRAGYALKEESYPLHTWFYDRIPERLCSCRYNRLVDIGGRKKRICGFMNRMDLVNPDSQDLQKLKQIIMVYHDKILG